MAINVQPVLAAVRRRAAAMQETRAKTSAPRTARLPIAWDPGDVGSPTASSVVTTAMATNQPIPRIAIRRTGVLATRSGRG